MKRAPEPITDVIFRTWHRRPHNIIALFPGLTGSHDVDTCASYMHVGQHSTADPLHVIHLSRAASYSEYKTLKSELEGPPYGYKLRVISRQTKHHRLAREYELSLITNPQEVSADETQ